MSYRLFVALDVPEVAKDALAGLQTPIDGAAWVKPAGFHITLKFLGDGIDQMRLSEIHEALAGIQADAFDYELRGAGRYPPNSKQAARVIWAGVHASPKLAALARQVDAAMVGVGFAPEKHTFSPHITLARLKYDREGHKVSEFLAKQHSFNVGGLRATEYHLVSSQLSPQGAIYTRVGSYFLK